MNEILQKLAAAKSPEEVQSCLDGAGYKLVSGDSDPSASPPADLGPDDPTAEEPSSAPSPTSMAALEGAAKKAMARPSRKEKKAAMKAEAKKAFGGFGG